MIDKSLSTEELTLRWEDQREIKNLMGKYANCIILNREHEVLDMFWSSESEDICLGFNNGYYKGRQAIDSYYNSVYERNKLVAGLIQKRFPEKLGKLSEDEIYGIGPFKVKPLACPLIEVAGDRKTAKGLWFCQGAYTEVEPAGPVARWTWGYFAVDFTLEDESWKIMNLLYLNDIDTICGQSWGKAPVEFPELPEFAPLKDFKMPEPNYPQTVREFYSSDRPLTKTPELPVAYSTFSETFSYGI